MTTSEPPDHQEASRPTEDSAERSTDRHGTDDAPLSVADEPVEPEAKAPEASPTKRRIRRGVLLLLTLLIFNYLVLPQLAGAREALDTLSHVRWWLLVLAVASALAALASYTQLTMAALPGDRHNRPIGFFTLLRIQLASKSVTNLVPGGSATGSALSYRLMISSGLSGTETGFALATVGLGSAVVLNVLLGVALLVSIPRSGLQPAYAGAAITGAVAISLVAILVFLLMKGEGPLDRIVRWIASKIPRLDPDNASKSLALVIAHLRELWARPDVVRRGIIWAAANWLFDAGSLWIFLAAFGSQVQIDSLLVAFGIANVLAVIPITPGGLGVVEAVLTSTLVGFGVPSSVATVSVVTYRLAQFWLPIPLGAMAYLSLKIWPGDPRRASRRERLGELANEVFN